MIPAEERLTRLVPGKGGDCTLIEGNDKTAVVDTGMAYCGDTLVRMVEEKLGTRKLDYIFLTHSHYDHAGGTPSLRNRWPSVAVVGSSHARDVFLRDGARKMIRRLAEMAGKLYDPSRSLDYLSYADADLEIDRVVKEGESIELGGCSVRVLETPGHTNCSLSYLLQSETAEAGSILFPCESIGCYVGNGVMVSPFLTGFQTTLDSIEKCRRCGAEAIVSPHYGLVTDLTPEAYLELARDEAFVVRDFILDAAKDGAAEEEILQRCVERFWTSRGTAREEQPLEAFKINTAATIRVVEKEFLQR